MEISVYAVYPDTCGRSYPYIFVYADVTVSEPVFFRASSVDQSFEMSGNESDACGRSYTIRIRYVWTQIILYPHKKNLPIQKYTDTCGRGLSLLPKFPFEYITLKHKQVGDCIFVNPGIIASLVIVAIVSGIFFFFDYISIRYNMLLLHRILIQYCEIEHYQIYR